VGAADVLTVTARHVEDLRRGPLHDAAEAFDRATRVPYGRSPPRSNRGDALRAMARLLRVVGNLNDDETLVAMLRLILTLSLLADALAEIRDLQHRSHQARAARTAARLLRAAVNAHGNCGSGAGVTPSVAPDLPTGERRDRRNRRTSAGTGRGR
jgi:hypothetical protein